MKEFNLSKHIYVDDWRHSIDLEYVKKFIRILKERIEFAGEKFYCKSWLLKELDKLVGDKLK